MLAAWVAGTGSTLIGKSEIGGHATVFHAVVPTSKFISHYIGLYIYYFTKNNFKDYNVVFFPLWISL